MNTASASTLISDGDLVRVDQVTKTYRTPAGTVRAVDAVTLRISARSTLGVVGESGSGKSTLGRLVLGFETPDRGGVQFEGTQLASLRYKELQRLRSRMTVVFQEPLGSLNPRVRVLPLVREPLDIHRRDLPPSERNELAEQALERVRLGPALYTRYPRQLSGGQQQRVNIARAIVTSPRFIVLDEPTSALDLSVQAQVLELLEELQRHLGLSYLFISHDMGCIGYLSHYVAVMYRGRVVELGPAAAVLDTPVHPYTEDLVRARLTPDPPDGGRRSPAAMDMRARSEAEARRAGFAASPALTEVAPGHFAAV